MIHGSVRVNNERFAFCRGYYRCSSSKGCPARKQVERSRMDPTMLLVTYSCEHNHPWPASRNHHNNHSNNHPTVKTEKREIVTRQPDPEPVYEERFADLGNDDASSLITTSDEFRWFSDMETTSSTILESPIFAERSAGDSDVAMFFPMREEDESLYADLGELPECSVVFRGMGPRVEIFWHVSSSAVRIVCHLYVHIVRIKITFFFLFFLFPFFLIFFSCFKKKKIALNSA